MRYGLKICSWHYFLSVYDVSLYVSERVSEHISEHVPNGAAVQSTPSHTGSSEELPERVLAVERRKKGLEIDCFGETTLD